MIQFTYSFCMAMLHSLWQAALLMLLYTIVDKLTHKNSAPLAKRNFLYAAITAQLILFSLTFSIYFFSSKGVGTFSNAVQNITDAFGSENLKIITPWIFSLYLFIIAGKLVKAIYSWLHFKHQFKMGLQKPPVELKLFTELKAYQFGIKRKVKLWLSHSVQTPVTFGFFKPIILLPVALVNHISTKQAETLILHELTHIRTHDYLLNWFLVIAETIFFFNPFITGLCKQIKLEREMHCDMNVISFEYSPALYAETLLLAERMKQLTPVFQLAAVNRKKHLLQRIQFFTNEKVLNQTLRFNIVAPLIGLVLLFMLSTAVLFQSASSAGQQQITAGMHYLPSDNYIISNTEAGTPVFTENIKTEQSTDFNQIALPVIMPEKSTIQPPPACEPMPENDAAETASPIDLNYAKPITATENDAARQIIIKEEGSTGATIKVYNLIFEDGKWILQPELIMISKEIMLDSLNSKTDSLQRKLKKIYPDQQ
ncbi:MAG: M56 family metallopeptidase [Chitinophagaceae bacterium]|nr:M56 family metallopeptidase [Chitinophagaceae bacterium]